MKEVESKLVPILREGVNVVKLIFFKKLKSYLSQNYPDREASYINQLSGTVINDLFGTPNTEEHFSSFVIENKTAIEAAINNIATEMEEMRIPLTDALRVQFLCDAMEGIDSSATLARAEKLNILLIDREVPLPKNFMNLVRELGSSFDIIIPPDIIDKTHSTRLH